MSRIIGFTGVWDKPGIVSVCSTDEEMTLDEWHRRYSDGTLIRFIYGDVDAEP